MEGNRLEVLCWGWIDLHYGKTKDELRMSGDKENRGEICERFHQIKLL